MINSVNSITYSIKSHSDLENARKAEKNRALVDKVFDFAGCTPEAAAKIKTLIQEEVLISTVGRKVIKALEKGQKKITLKEGPTLGPRFAYYDEEYKGPRICFNLSVNYYYIALDEQGKKCVKPGTLGQVFVHEAVHAFNYQIEPKGYKNLYPRARIFDEMDNLEEQITICGLMMDGKIQRLCENAYLATQGKPPRINHRAFIVPTTETLNLVDLASYGVTKPLEEALDRNSASINVPEKLHASKEKMEGKHLTLLSAAVCAGRIDVVNLLLKRGADPLATDELGGALFAAISHSRFEILEILLKQCHVDAQLKNPQGKTFISEFALATQKFSENHDPPFWHMVGNCFKKLMNPNEPVINQLLQHKASGHLVKVLLKPEEIQHLDSDGNTILMNVIKKGDVRCFKELLHDCSFNLEVANNQNETALTLALQHTDAEIASEIIYNLREKGVIIPNELQSSIDTLLKPLYEWQVFG